MHESKMLAICSHILYACVGVGGVWVSVGGVRMWCGCCGCAHTYIRLTDFPYLPSSLTQEKCSTAMQVSELSKHKDLLLDKLAEFDSTNQSLRKMLRSQQNFEVRVCNGDLAR